jgi:hypothetical protein
VPRLDEEYETKPGPARRLRRPKAASSSAAHRLEQQLQWLAWPLFYWAGNPGASRNPGESWYVPVRPLLEWKMARLPAGLYALRLQAKGGINPELAEIRELTPHAVAEALAALQASRKFPRALARFVGNVDAWREKAEAALSALAPQALRAAPPRLEEVAFFLGAEAARPSAGSSKQDLLQRLAKGGPEARLAAVLAGRRGLSVNVPRELAAHQAWGTFLNRWPPEIVLRVAESPAARALLSELRNERTLLNHRDAALAVEELYFVAPCADATPLLRALPEALRAADAKTGSRHHEVPFRLFLAGLTGRAASVMEPALFLHGALAWLGVIERLFERGLFVDRRDYFRTSLEAWLAQAAWSRDHVEALLAFLEKNGEPLVRQALNLPAPLYSSSWETFVQQHRLLGALGQIEPGLRQVLVETNRYCLEAANSVFRTRPDQLAPLLESISRWRQSDRSGEPWWLFAELFSTEPSDLFARLLRWLWARTAPGASREATAVRFIGSVTDALSTGSASQNKSRQDLVRRHSWILDELHDSGNRDALCSSSVVVCLDLLIDSGAARQGAHRLLQALLGSKNAFGEEPDYLRFCLRLAGNDPRRFVLLIERGAPRPRWDYPASPAEAWTALAHCQSARDFLSSCCDEEALVGRVWRLLQRVALVCRHGLSGSLVHSLHEWSDPPFAEPPPEVTQAPEPLRGALSDLARHRKSAGEPDLLPTAVKDILRRGRSMQNELERLRLLAEQGRLPARAHARLANLESYQANPDRFEARLERDLRSAVAHQLLLARLQGLEQVTTRMLAVQRQRIGLPSGLLEQDPDVENALEIYRTSRSNRRLLRRLFSQTAAGRRVWPLDHPDNQRLLAQLASHGLDVRRWTGALEHEFQHGARRWKIYAESDPFRVLQMGNLFSTCLSSRGCNAWSTIANAVEANKRVLYVSRPGGAIIGRRLIGVGMDAEQADKRPGLVGFHSYGAQIWTGDESDSSASPWVKIDLDLMCFWIARETGARLLCYEEELARVARSLKLFARWYNDGAEPYDWWVDPEYVGEDLRPAAGGEPLFEALSTKLRNAAREEPRGHTAADVRAALWLSSVSRELFERLPLPEEPGVQRFLRRWAVG